MRDEDFSIFIDEMGEADSHRKVSSKIITKYKGILPNVLLKYWQEEGWCSYAGGLFWTVNPEEYSHLLSMWLNGTPFKDVDRYHVIARSAFGDLYAWGERFNRKITVSCATNSIIAVPKEVNAPSRDPDLAIQSFFAMSDKEAYDIEDSQGEPLFERALEKLGPLSQSEVYGFEPALVMGGAASLKNLAKLDLEVHLTILRQFAVPQVPFGI